MLKIIEKLLVKFRNRGSKNLSKDLLRLVHPCDGCGSMPILNPHWLTHANPRWGNGRQFILGCPSAMWGGCEVYETVVEAIDNWNYHVGGYNNHPCGLKKGETK